VIRRVRTADHFSAIGNNGPRRGPYACPGAMKPGASCSDRAAISALARKCLDAKGIGCEAWEKEIDDRVAALYGL